VDVVRKNPTLYFPNGVATLSFLLAAVNWDALSLGAHRLDAKIDGLWAVAAADVDWFALPKDYRCHGIDLFDGIHHAPWTGQNAMRAEVLVGASAASLCVVTGGTAHSLRGATCPDRLRALMKEPWVKGAVAFSLAAA
jgi:hypothetical protein